MVKEEVERLKREEEEGEKAPEVVASPTEVPKVESPASNAEAEIEIRQIPYEDQATLKIRRTPTPPLPVKQRDVARETNESPSKGETKCLMS